MVKMLLLIQFLVFAATASALECPPRDKVYPCSCVEEQGLAVINCEDFNSVEELEPAVKNTIGYNVSFGFYRSHLVAIPSDFFKGHTSVKLHFSQCVVGSFGEPPFTGLEDSLETLNFYSVIDDKDFTEMKSFKLSHLKKLKYVVFAYNVIEELRNDWFDGGPTSVQQINLSGNEIETVGERALASLGNLQQLYINENQIKDVARSMLPNPAQNLWLIDANSNQIEELPSDAFEGFPNLRFVNLSKNKLKSIPENVWGKVWKQLESVSLNENDIVCDENLKWIYSQKLPNRFEGKCGPGNNLHGKDLNSLKLEDFQ